MVASLYGSPNFGLETATVISCYHLCTNTTTINATGIAAKFVQHNQGVSSPCVGCAPVPAIGHRLLFAPLRCVYSCRTGSLVVSRTEYPIEKGISKMKAFYRQCCDAGNSVRKGECRHIHTYMLHNIHCRGEAVQLDSLRSLAQPCSLACCLRIRSTLRGRREAREKYHSFIHSRGSASRCDTVLLTLGKQPNNNVYAIE